MQLPEVLSVQLHAFQKKLSDILRQLCTEVLHRFQPVFTPDAGLDASPCRFLIFFRERILFEPVTELPAEAFQIASASGHRIRLPQADPVAMPVKLIDKLRIPLRHILPVDVRWKLHGLRRRLHIPGKIEDEPLLDRVIRDPQDVCTVLRPVFSAVPCALMILSHVHDYPFTPPAMMPSTNHL